MKKVKVSIVALVLAVALTACTETTTSNGTIKEQQQDKINQAERMMQQTRVPAFNESLERENIRNRLIVSNDPNTLQWIYPMSAGRVIGRFPVKGKVTSGGKRLTSTDMFTWGDGGEYGQDFVTEAPDEMGTYGNSGDYLFWFDPAGRIHQFKGDYFVSPVPYKIDVGNGTLALDVDVTEENKRDIYEKQIKDSNAKQATTESGTVVNQGGK